VVEARSSVGPIAWEGAGPTGTFALTIGDDGVDLSDTPQGELSFRLDALTSGNRVYDAELRRRLEIPRFPVARAELAGITAGDTPARFHARGRLDVHGVARPVTGDLEVSVGDDGTVLVTGRQRVDIRDFGLPAPTTLMLKVFPDVQVHLVVAGDPLD
jgi:polyisoprenoid-binding protein YceI